MHAPHPPRTPASEAGTFRSLQFQKNHPWEDWHAAGSGEQRPACGLPYTPAAPSRPESVLAVGGEPRIRKEGEHLILAQAPACINACNALHCSDLRMVTPQELSMSLYKAFTAPPGLS